jgi:uncharacterized delta-60 repeat protein
MRGQGRGGRLALAAIAALCALLAIATAATAAGGAAGSASAGGGTATESIGQHYWETGFSALTARPDGGLVAVRDDQLESFLPSGLADPAAPPRKLPQYSRWFPLPGGRSFLLDSSKLTRLNPDGSVDSGFGQAGTVAAPYYIQAAAELPSGRFVLAGTGSGGTHQIFYWVSFGLLEADGSAAGKPGGSGGAQLSLPGDGGGVSEIVPTPDGGALVVGGHFLLELRADGSPNPGFGAGGLVIHSGLSLVGARVLPDGSIEAVGFASGPSGKDLVVVRFTATGQPDTGFGGEGARLFDLGGEEEAHAATWAADGSVVVGGASQTRGSCYEVVGCEEVPVLAAFSPEGKLEPGFGTGGVVRLEALRGESEGLRGHGVALLTRRPDGSIAAAGTAPPGETTAFLAALSPAGALLPGFGEGGIVRERRSTPAQQTIAGIAPLAGGGTLALGISTLGIDRTPVLIRYAADGSLDRSFGGGAGYVAIGKARFVDGFAADGSGHLLTTLYGYPQTSLVELNASDGSRVESFGTDGSVLLPKSVFAEAVDFAAGGRGATVIGTRDVGGPAEPGVVVRYGPDGRPDDGFGNHGVVDLRAPGQREMRARALTGAPGGRTLVAGFSHHSFALVRLRADGSPDPRFGSRGWSLTGTGGQPLVSRGGSTRGVALARDGSHLYLAGATREGKRLHLVLLRFGVDGRLDRGFGQGGRRTVSIPKAAEPVSIVPGGRGVLVVLNGGPRPLVSFGPGRVRQRPVGQGRDVSNVRAALSGGRLLLGWNARESGTFNDVYYLGERPLGGR